ncbi:MAG TPA: LCP family protein [Marmoricola sp.]|jgi:LCP family protein required for cell wall assembly|nr:LCP family protein [Marmoricola sp.]
MPDRPSDSPDYNWLYGQEHPDSDDDHTRVLPTLKRPDQRRDAGSGPPPDRIARTPGGERPRRRHRFGLGRLIVLVVLLYLVYLVAVPFWAWQKMDTVAAAPAGDRPAEQPGTTYLVVGSDSRKGLTKEEARKIGAEGGDIGQRTDTIMLMHTGDGPSLLLSIPRDSLVPIPGHGTTKINAAFAYGGAKLLVQTIEQNTGVRIDHFVEIGFGGFVNAVDAVGGVTICPKKAMKDPLAHLDIKAGCQEVDGITALGYARSRHTSGLGDISRAEHQREVVSAIGDEVKSPWTVLNPVRYFRLNLAMTQSIRVGEDTGPVDMAKLAFAMTRVNGQSGLTCGMPIADLAVHWDSERALRLLKLIQQDRTADVPKELCTPDGLAK